MKGQMLEWRLSAWWLLGLAQSGGHWDEGFWDGHRVVTVKVSMELRGGGYRGGHGLEAVEAETMRVEAVGEDMG